MDPSQQAASPAYGNPYFGMTVQRLASWPGMPAPTREALTAMSFDESFNGNADPSILNLVDGLIVGNDRTEILQLGTLIGFSAVIIANALRITHENTGKPARLDTVDPNVTSHAKAKKYVRQAQLDPYVTFWEGLSTDLAVSNALKSKTYDLIFIDSSHSYRPTVQEIELYWPLLRVGGYMIFHDAGEAAAQFDPSKEGGVRRALAEWLASGPKDLYAHLLLEPPFWANPCGAFWAIKGDGSRAQPGASAPASSPDASRARAAPLRSQLKVLALETAQTWIGKMLARENRR